MTEIAAPYQDPSLDVDRRVEDLLGRMEPADKAGLMFHDMVVMGPGGTLGRAGQHDRAAADREGDPDAADEPSQPAGRRFECP